MLDREVIEKVALSVAPSHLTYDLWDTIDDTPDKDLLKLIKQSNRTAYRQLMAGASTAKG